MGRDLSVDSGSHDQPVEPFQVPSAVGELGGQPVEQHGVSRFFAPLAELAGRVDQAASEVVHPDAIDQGAADQGMTATGQPPGPRQAASGGRSFLVVGFDHQPLAVGGGHRQAARGHLVAGLPMIAAVEQLGHRHLAGHRHQHSQEFLLRLPAADRLDPLVERLDLVGVLLVVLVEIAAGDVELGVFLQQGLLFGGPLFVGSGLGRLEFPTKRFVETGQFLGQCLGDVGVPFLVPLALECLGLGFDRGGPGFLGVVVQGQFSLARVLPGRRVERRLENGPDAVVVVLGDRVITVIVTLSTAQRDTHQGRGDNLERVGDDLVPGSRAVGTAAGAVGGHPQESRRGHQFDAACVEFVARSLQQFVTGKLFGDETIESPVGVDRPDHVVAELPGFGSDHVFVCHTFAVGVAGDVQPVSAPSLSVLRVGQQPVDQPFPGVGRGVGNERGEFFGRGGPAEQIQVRASGQRAAVGVGRESQASVAHGLFQQGIDRGADSLRGVVGRHNRAFQRYETPPRSLFGSDSQAVGQSVRLRPGGRGPGRDPLAARLDLGGRHLFLPWGQFAGGLPGPQAALLRGSGHDRRTALSSGNHQPPQPQIQLAPLLLFGPVAVEAVRPQDRADVTLVGQRGIGRRQPGRGVGNQQRQKEADEQARHGQVGLSEVGGGEGECRNLGRSCGRTFSRN